jgi:predicted acylesterase/phospholipase RssA
MKILLALTGGGVRGLATLPWLEELERAAGIPIREGVDGIVGTSTGAIVALGLAAGHSPRSLRTFYRADGPRIFSASRWHRARTLWGLRGPRYPGSELAGALHRRIGTQTLGETSVLTLTTETELPTLELADGGLWANNPTLIALAEALDRWPGEEIAICTVGTTPRNAYDRSIVRKSDQHPTHPAWIAAYASAAAPTYFPPIDRDGRLDGKASGWGFADWGREGPTAALGGADDSVHWMAERITAALPGCRYWYVRPPRAGGELDDASLRHLSELEAMGVEMAYRYRREAAEVGALMALRRDAA